MEFEKNGSVIIFFNEDVGKQINKIWHIKRDGMLLSFNNINETHNTWYKMSKDLERTVRMLLWFCFKNNF
jgi:hypothetical protein